MELPMGTKTILKTLRGSGQDYIISNLLRQLTLIFQSCQGSIIKLTLFLSDISLCTRQWKNVMEQHKESSRPVVPAFLVLILSKSIFMGYSSAYLITYTDSTWWNLMKVGSLREHLASCLHFTAKEMKTQRNAVSFSSSYSFLVKKKKKVTEPNLGSMLWYFLHPFVG